MKKHMKPAILAGVLMVAYVVVFQLTSVVYVKWKFVSVNYLVYGLFYRTPAQDYLSSNDFVVLFIWYAINFVVLLSASWIYFRERLVGRIILIAFLAGLVPFIDFSSVFI